MDEKWIRLVGALIDIGYTPRGVAHELAGANIDMAERSRSERGRNEFFKFYEKLSKLSVELE